MTGRTRYAPILRAALALIITIAAWEGLGATRSSVVLWPSCRKMRRPDNEELKRLYTEDQADRMPKDGKAIDWKIVSPRDQKRLPACGNNKSPLDCRGFYHVAMVCSTRIYPMTFTAAHELCVVAIGKTRTVQMAGGGRNEDRFLMNINRPQRFGTQYRATELDEPFRLYKMDEGVTDELRRLLMPVAAKGQGA